MGVNRTVFEVCSSQIISAEQTPEAERQRLKQACEDFEAIFLQEVLKGLRRTVPDNHSSQERLYRSLLDGQLARICARRGLGLGDMLMDELSAMHGRDRKVSGPDEDAKALNKKTDNLNVIKKSLPGEKG